MHVGNKVSLNWNIFLNLIFVLGDVVISSTVATTVYSPPVEEQILLLGVASLLTCPPVSLGVAVGTECSQVVSR